MPHQAALEYNRNRYEVIADQEKAYKEFTEKITQIQKDLQSTSKPPFLSEKVHDHLNEVFEKVSSEVEESIHKYCGYLKLDSIYEELSNLFENKISEPFEDDKLSELYIKGQLRFEKKIPPGYEDEKNKVGNEKYGDFILWMQVIAKAKESNAPIIFITDERKKDWWWKIKDGRNMGPRQELTEEIMKEAKVDFHMYSSERFLSFGQKFLKQKVNQEALEEIQAMKRAEMEQIRKIKRRSGLQKRKLEEEMEKKFALEKEQANLQKRIYKFEVHLDSLMKNKGDTTENQEYIESIMSIGEKLKEELKDVDRKLKLIGGENWRSIKSKDSSSRESLLIKALWNEIKEKDESN